MEKFYLKPDKLICNSAFVEPTRHWKYDAKYVGFYRMEQRREAGYVVATPGSQKMDDPGKFVPLDLVNRIRPLVKAWRQSNYSGGITGTTRRLLDHWNDVTQRENRRFFFCQLEAIETLIWLTEVADLKAEGISIPSDGGPFPRWCTKLATGTGKTIVMAMLIAWQTLNRDLAKVPRLQLNAHETATRAELAVVLGGKPDLTNLSEIDLEELGRSYRQQRIVFETARDVFDQMKPGWNGSRDVLLSQVIHLVERMLSSNRISITPDLFNTDELRRRIVLTMNMSKIVHHIWEAIRCENTQRLEPVFDSQRPILSTSNMRPWYTGRPCDPTRRSHINLCVFDSTHEKNAAIELDREKQQHVAAWVKNDHLDFEILYVFQGVVRKYRPDFLIRLTDGTTLILEIKGQDTQEAQVKRRFLEEWVRTVNAHGGFGQWAGDFSLNPKDVGELLKRHNT